MKSFDVIGIGTVLVDQRMVMDHFPERDTKQAVVSHRQQVGGPFIPTLNLAANRASRCRLTRSSVSSKLLGLSIHPSPPVLHAPHGKCQGANRYDASNFAGGML